MEGKELQRDIVKTVILAMMDAFKELKSFYQFEVDEAVLWWICTISSLRLVGNFSRCGAIALNAKDLIYDVEEMYAKISKINLGVSERGALIMQLQEKKSALRLPDITLKTYDDKKKFIDQVFNVHHDELVFGQAPKTTEDNIDQRTYDAIRTAYMLQCHCGLINSTPLNKINKKRFLADQFYITIVLSALNLFVPQLISHEDDLDKEILGVAKKSEDQDLDSRQIMTKILLRIARIVQNTNNDYTVKKKSETIADKIVALIFGGIKIENLKLAYSFDNHLLKVVPLSKTAKMVDLSRVMKYDAVDSFHDLTLDHNSTLRESIYDNLLSALEGMIIFPEYVTPMDFALDNPKESLVNVYKSLANKFVKCWFCLHSRSYNYNNDFTSVLSNKNFYSSCLVYSSYSKIDGKFIQSKGMNNEIFQLLPVNLFMLRLPFKVTPNIDEVPIKVTNTLRMSLSTFNDKFNSEKNMLRKKSVLHDATLCNDFPFVSEEMINTHEMIMTLKFKQIGKKLYDEEKKDQDTTPFIMDPTQTSWLRLQEATSHQCFVSLYKATSDRKRFEFIIVLAPLAVQWYFFSGIHD